ncbi:nucleotidyltransferase family protein [Candidatus Woesearchaeota archaeon]|nr:nucleotidyltransferase family protein [Candidatus Woesearchaeota archaeon]
MAKEAVILCGGSGKRLGKIGEELPKALVPINGKPIIDYQIEWLKKYGVDNIVLACGHKREKIKEHLGDSVKYAFEDEPLGTGGAVKNSLKYIKGEEFFCLNVDDITDIDLKKLKGLGSNAVCLARYRCPAGVAKIENGIISEFREKPVLDNVWVSCGVYMLNKKIDFPDRGSIEYDIFPKIKPKAFKHEGRWITINTQKDLEEAEKAMKG